ncbi:MAG TPA: hypothetical protein VGD59_07085 [Acidisarcina sp.]
MTLLAAPAGFIAGCGGGGGATTTAPSITWATPAPITYGTPLSSTQLDVSGAGAGSIVTYTPPAGTVLPAGVHTLTAVETFLNNNLSATASVSLTVNKATPAITWATPAAVAVGTALTTTQLNATATAPGAAAALPGAFAYTPALGTVMNTAGAQTLSVTFTPADATDYNTATATVSLTVTGTSAGPSYTWKNVQIVAGGYVPGIVMHPRQQGLMYARTDIGGAYRYDASAKQWAPLTDWISRANSSNMGIESVAIDPSDPQRVYLATGLYTETWWSSNGQILTSSDQGNTFTSVQMPFKMGSNDNGRAAGERLAVDPNNGANLFFGSRLNGLWYSPDHGATWSQVTTFPGTVTTSTPGTLDTSGVGIVFELFVKTSEAPGASTQTIYAGVSALGTGTDLQSLYVSKDAGKTWNAVPGAPTGLYLNHGVLSADGAALYFTCGDAVGPYGLNTGAVKKYLLPTTANPAGVWSDITPPRDANHQGGYGAVAIDINHPGVLMVSTLDHYYPVGDDLWRTTNDGTTWYSINAVGANRDGSLSPWIYFGYPSIVNTGNWVTALQIDPFDSNHIVYGTGQTIWSTDNMQASDGSSPAASNWTIDAQGVEEADVLKLISPPSGPAHLLSQMGDICGFQHLDLTRSPVTGMMKNPQCTTGTSIDFAQSNPLVMARVGNGGSIFGGTSADGGTTWKPFAAQPATSAGSGAIAVSADGKTLVWEPSDAPTSWSSNLGATWTTSTGAPAQQPVVSDRINAQTFYVYDGSAGVLWKSIDSGATFTTAQSSLPQYGTLVASSTAAGNLWLSTSAGLYHATAGGLLTPIAGVDSAWNFAEGAPASGSSQPAYYIDGVVGGVDGLYRSVDAGATWIRINDDQHQYGYINTIAADPRVFGRIYLGTSGRGIIYGDSPN